MQVGVAYRWLDAVVTGTMVEVVGTVVEPASNGNTIPCITVGAKYHGSMYQSRRLPPKKHRALPWGLSTTVACTRVVNYHPESTVHYRGV